MVARTCAVFLVLLALTARADVPAPFDDAAYAPRGPIPDGVARAFVEDRDGKRWVCGDGGDRQTCVDEAGVFAAWRGKVGEKHVDVRVRALAPARAKGARAWARSLWVTTHGSAREWPRARMRTWIGAAGRVAEAEVQWGGSEMDPSWTLIRFEERSGWVLYLRVQVSGVPDDGLRAALRRAFAGATE